MNSTSSVNIDLPADPTRYDVLIGRDLLKSAGKWARECVGSGATRAAIISNASVHGRYGQATLDSLRNEGFTVEPFLIGDGEQYKTWKTAETALDFLSRERMSRSSVIVALGGGVVGDLAGFVSAIYLRGIDFLQIPTSLLAMIDSSVGGKTGINSSFGKNLIGAFRQPRGVLIDTTTLQTLPQREISAGLCEAIKHGAIGGPKVLAPVRDLLLKYPPRDFERAFAKEGFHSLLADLIATQVSFKAEIVVEDAHESPDRTDKRSRKILNFGHTFAHALEKVTGYTYLKHGEAVGYGILFAAELSKTLALCSKNDVELLNGVVQSVGPLPVLTGIDPENILDAFKLDKKNVSGSLQLILLKGIGKPVIVSDRYIPPAAIKKVLKQCLAQWS
jgi:3-dehydroquinate synthase